ncbi:MAG: Hsp20/alpha crystallin family protein [Polyangiaceae bacterium]
MLTRWDPFGDIGRMQDDMVRWGFWPFGPSARAFSPAVDVYEDDDAIRVQAELPGVRPEDVQVQVEENQILTIRGERKQEREEKGEGYQRVERAYGSFHRSFTLPSGVNADKIEAEMSDGVLYVRLPKKPVPEPKRISVRGTGGKQERAIGGQAATAQMGAGSHAASAQVGSAQAGSAQAGSAQASSGKGPPGR